MNKNLYLLSFPSSISMVIACELNLKDTLQILNNIPGGVKHISGAIYLMKSCISVTPIDDAGHLHVHDLATSIV